MKSLKNMPCFLLLLFTVMSLFLSSRAMAYDPKNDLVSAIDLKPTGLMMKKALSENGTTKKGSSSQEFSIPVSDSVSTYVDCSTPSRHDHTSKETSQDFRTVFGFHFVLK